jgi:hypothetical protein
VVVQRRDNQHAVVGYRWGLVPSWTDRSARVPARMFNARRESVAAKTAFRVLLAKHRLIVPADGFYEWRRGPELARQPYYIRRADGRQLALAGLWTSWHDPEQPSIRNVASELQACRRHAGTDAQAESKAHPPAIQSRRALLGPPAGWRRVCAGLLSPDPPKRPRDSRSGTAVQVPT